MRYFYHRSWKWSKCWSSRTFKRQNHLPCFQDLLIKFFFLKLSIGAFLSIFASLICSLSAFLILEVVKIILLERVKCFCMLILFVWMLFGLPRLCFEKRAVRKFASNSIFSAVLRLINNSSSNCSLLRRNNLYKISKNALEKKYLDHLWKDFIKIVKYIFFHTCTTLWK